MKVLVVGFGSIGNRHINNLVESRAFSKRSREESRLDHDNRGRKRRGPIMSKAGLADIMKGQAGREFGDDVYEKRNLTKLYATQDILRMKRKMQEVSAKDKLTSDQISNIIKC